METTESLGTLLKDMRASRQMTQAQAAEAAGLARSTLNRWELGAFQPRLPELEAMLHVLAAPPPLREKALTLMSAPRAIRSLQREREPRLSPQNDAWVYTPDTGDLLRAMRLRSGQTQERVAEQIGVRCHIISRWEGGELIPSAERMNDLMTLLSAHPEERTALMRGALSPLRLTAGEDASFDSVKAQYDALALRDYDANLEPLKDLEYLRLERAFANLIPQLPIARQFLIYTYAWHAQWLSHNNRYKEAGRYADRIIEAVHQETVPVPEWQRVILTAARCAVYGGDRPRPERGAQMLESWLPLVTHPSFEAWILSDMALYLSQEGQMTAAHDFATRACRVAQRCENPIELRLRRDDRAEILLLTGTPDDAQRALDLLPVHPLTQPGQSVREALLWAKALLLTGEISQAQAWLNRAQKIVPTFPLDRSAVDALAKRF